MVLRAGFHGTVGQPSAQVIDGSVKIDDASNHFMTRTPGSAGNRKTWTWSGWVKRQQIVDKQTFMFASTDSNNQTSFGFMHNQVSAATPSGFYFRSEISGSVVNAEIEATLRDTSNFYHIVVACDTTQSAASDRVKIYINGTLQGFAVNPGMSQNADLEINNSVLQELFSQDASGDLDAYVSQVYFIDGLALTPENFGFTDPLTNTWRPKKFSAFNNPNNGTTWSNGAFDERSGQNPANAFNGNTSDYYQVNTDSDGGGVNFSGGLTGTLKVYAATGQPNNGDTTNTVTLSNGTTKTTSQGYNNGAEVLDFGSVSNITSIAITNSGLFYAFEVNGILLVDGRQDNSFYLPMDGNSPIGEDKSGVTTINNGTIWSNDVTTSNGYSANRDPSKGFDGNSSLVGQSNTYVQSDTSAGGTVTWTPNGYTIDTADEILVKGINSLDRLSVVGSLGSQSNIAPATVNSITNVYTIPTNLGTLTSLTVTGNSSLAGWSGISVGGVLLVDGLKGNSWTPVNFGGSLELDNPNVSGARPILNTTQGGTVAGVGVFGSKENVGYAVTVYNDGGGNKYYIDGVKQATLTGLIRGATYTFDTSDSTVGSTHPFRFAASDGGSQYSNGVAAITGTATTITIPYDAPNELYYYCTSHSGMGSSITGITTNEKLADQYASHCVLAVPFINGLSNDVSPSIACTSTKKSLTQQGNPTSSTSSNFYSSSTDFDGTGDYYTSGSESDFTFGTGDFTVEFWVDSDGLDGSQDGFLQISDASGGLKTGYTNGFAIYEGANAGTVNTAGLSVSIPSTAFIKAGVWNHIALVREGTRVRLFANGILAGSGESSKNMTASYLALGGYYDANYVYNGRMQDFRIYKGVAKYTSNFVVPATSPDILPDTPSGVSGSSKLTKITDGAVNFDGNNDYLSIADSADLDQEGDFTQECFYYQSGSGQGSTDVIFIKNVTNYGYIGVDFGGTNQIKFFQHNIAALITGPVLASRRWYHLAATRSGSTVRLFVDGVLVGSTTYSTDTTGTAVSYIGGFPSAHSLNGFISDLRVIKGTALYTKNFTPPSAPLTNVTNTKLLCCQSNSSAVNYAVSPGTISKHGDAAATNFNPFNTDINTVRGQETGYATFNPLDSGHDGASITFSDGNLKAAFPSTSGTGQAPASIYVSSGKWYCEYYLESVSDLTSVQYGIVSPGSKRASYIGKSDTTDQYGWEPEIDRAYNNGNNTTPTGKTFTSQWSVAAMALDLDNGTWEMFIDGIPTGTIYSGISGTYTFAVGDTMSSGYHTHTANFGQKPFKFAPPDGFQPLNAANTRPETVIARPDQFVGISTWTGDGNTGRNIRTLQFKPDLVWIKQRSATRAHALFDSVRGANKRLQSSSTNAQTTHTDQMSAFIDNGFTVEDNNTVNVNGGTYVGWSWRAGGNKNTFNIDDVGYASAAAAGLTAGDTTPTGASVGTKQGFSIIKYTGPNDTNNHEVPHGLSQAPDFIITKNLDATYNWDIYHSSLADDAYLIFTTAATRAQGFNGRPTSTVFKTEHDYSTNENQKYIAYCWHDVPGLQKFGEYIGNGNADGAFIELGFRPRIIIAKASTGGGSVPDWLIFDSERDSFNPADKNLSLNYTGIEQYYTGGLLRPTDIDFLSNGFKIRNVRDANNANGSNFIYAAWAEAPSVNLFGGSSNAR